HRSDLHVQDSFYLWSCRGAAGVSNDTPVDMSSDVTLPITAPGGPSWAMVTPPKPELRPNPVGGGADTSMLKLPSAGNVPVCALAAAAPEMSTGVIWTVCD